jgi:hypothetical protein
MYFYSIVYLLYKTYLVITTKYMLDLWISHLAQASRQQVWRNVYVLIVTKAYMQQNSDSKL